MEPAQENVIYVFEIIGLTHLVTVAQPNLEKLIEDIEYSTHDYLNHYAKTSKHLPGSFCVVQRVRLDGTIAEIIWRHDIGQDDSFEDDLIHLKLMAERESSWNG